MQKDKRGISGIIVALIMILLALVASGAIFIVVRNVTTGGTEDIEFGTKCLDSFLSVTAVDCSDGTECNVTVKREAGIDVIDGIRIIVSDGSDSDSLDTEENLVTPNIATYTVNLTSAGTPITSVEASIYFDNAQETPRTCTGAIPFTNIANP